VAVTLPVSLPLQRMLESRESTRSGAFHRVERALQCGRNLGFGKVKEVAQHQHRALARRRRRQRAEQLVVPGRLVHVGCEAIGDRLAGELVAAAGAPVGAREREVDEDPACVRHRARHSPNPRPAPGHLQQRLLNQVLCLV
jgi:hypothetical protein